MRAWKLAPFASIALGTLAALPAARAQEVGQLEEIVVTARKREEALQTTPVSVSAFSGEALERMNVREVTRIAAFAPNLDLIPSGTSQGIAVSLRGIASYDPILTNEPSVGMYLDGVYVNALSFGLFDMLDLERVEVLRGPQGSLFGRNTTGGAINIVTKKPSRDFGLEQKLSYGSFDAREARTVLDTGDFAPGWNAKLSYQYRQRDGTVDDLGRPSSRDPGALRSHAARLALHGDVTDTIFLDYAVDWNRRRDNVAHNQFTTVSPDYAAYFGNSAALGGDPLRVSGGRLTDVREPAGTPAATNRSLNHALTLAWQPSQEFQVKSITGYRDWNSAERSTFGSSAGLRAVVLDPVTFAPSIQSVDPYIGGGTKNLTQWSEELQILGQLDRISYVVGGFFYDADYAENNPQSYIFVLPGGQAGVPGAGRLAYQGGTRSYAAFGQASYTPPLLDDKLEVTVGLRHTIDKKKVATQVYPNGVPPALESVQAKTFKDTSFNVTVDYQWTDRVMTYARVGTGYRAGGFSPRGFDGPAYDPEKATTYEAGIKSELLDRRLRANLAGFYTRYKDLQVAQAGFSQTAGFVSNTVNAGKADYKGLELEVTALLTRGLTLEGSLGYVDPTYKQFLFREAPGLPTVDVKDSAKFAFMAKFSANVGLAYRFDPLPWGELSVRADFGYKSGHVFEPLGALRDALATSARRDLSARITLAEIPAGPASLQVSLWGENLLDQDYRHSGIDFGALGFGTSVYAPPRMLGVDLTARF